MNGNNKENSQQGQVSGPHVPSSNTLGSLFVPQASSTPRQEPFIFSQMRPPVHTVFSFNQPVSSTSETQPTGDHQPAPAQITAHAPTSQLFPQMRTSPAFTLQNAGQTNAAHVRGLSASHITPDGGNSSFPQTQPPGARKQPVLGGSQTTPDAGAQAQSKAENGAEGRQDSASKSNQQSTPNPNHPRSNQQSTPSRLRTPGGNQTSPGLGLFAGVGSPLLDEQRPAFNSDPPEPQPMEDGTMVYEFDTKEHVRTLVHAMHYMQIRRQFTDCDLIAKNNKDRFHFHGVLLAAASSMFRELFANSKMNFYRGTLHPPDATSKVLQCLFDYIYKPDLFSALLGNTPAAFEFLEKFGLTEAFLESNYEPAEILGSLNEMYESRTITYTVFTVGETEFPCHGAIAAAVTTYLFEPDAEGNLNESYDPISVEDCASETLEQLLTFAYTATVQIDESFALDALRNFCRWDVPALYNATCDFLKRNLRPDNAVRVYLCSKQTATEFHNKSCEKLQAETLGYIKNNVKSVVKTEDFLVMYTEEEWVRLLVLVLNQTASRSDLVQAVLEWYQEGLRRDEEREEAMARLITSITLTHDPQGVTQQMHMIEKANGCGHLTAVAKALLPK